MFKHEIKCANMYIYLIIIIIIIIITYISDCTVLSTFQNKLFSKAIKGCRKSLALCGYPGSLGHTLGP